MCQELIMLQMRLPHRWQIGEIFKKKRVAAKWWMLRQVIYKLLVFHVWREDAEKNVLIHGMFKTLL